MNAQQYTELKGPYAAAAKVPASNIRLYASCNNAKNAAFNSKKTKAVVMGENGYYVVCSSRVASRLVAAGYEYAS